MDSNIRKDHKQIGQELELFFNDDVAPGAPFWLPKGMVIFKELEKYIRELTENAGYQETSTPIMVKSELFKQSGHWEKFGEHNMYNLPIYENEEEEEFKTNFELAEKEGKVKVFKLKNNLTAIFPVVNYSLKPMNCPEATVIYRFRPRSYRELPLRFSEIGRLHRREKSGEVNGLLRVRQITMDDAHIFARENQILDEVLNILGMMIEFYKKFGFEYEFRFATRPEQKAGSEAMWDKAEKDLEEVLKKKGIKAGDKKGDGAFYGPKIDMHIKDALGRQWQLATVQLDFHMPQAFDLGYVNEEGKMEKPVMVHRAIFGSFERFIAILTEHYQGSFPLWLSPAQVTLIPISEKNVDFAKKINQQFKKANIRCELNDRNERMQAKIREATLQKVPYIGIIGNKEQEESEKDRISYFSVRTRSGEDLGKIEVGKFINKLKEEIEKRL